MLKFIGLVFSSYLLAN